MPGFSIEEHIRRAMEEGQFDNLPGKGRPLHLVESPHEDPEWRMANHILKSGGFTLPWIENLRQIETDVESARFALKRAWVWRQEAQAEGRLDELVDNEWLRALETFRAKVSEVNKRIFDYNLQAPADQFQHGMIDAEQEIKAIYESGALP